MAADGFNENGEIVVPDCVHVALGPLIGHIDALDETIGAIDSELAASVRADETAKRLMTIPGVGPVTASAIVATIQDAGAFASGREFAAFLGLTPRQNSTGGKTRDARAEISRSSSLLAAALLVAGAERVPADEPPLAPKVLVITMFAGEAKPWLDGASFPRKIAVPGLAKAFPEVACSNDGLCMTKPAWATPTRRVRSPQSCSAESSI